MLKAFTPQLRLKLELELKEFSLSYHVPRNIPQNYHRTVYEPPIKVEISYLARDMKH